MRLNHLLYKTADSQELAAIIEKRCALREEKRQRRIRLSKAARKNRRKVSNVRTVLKEFTS